MKTEILKLSQLAVNEQNPRSITEDKFGKLINSILVLPKMLQLRPIVVDDKNVILGGNMRLRALQAIADMKLSDIEERLRGTRSFGKKTTAEQENLLAYWEMFLSKPTAYVVKASELTEEEQHEFIIKDNVGYGDWDMDVLTANWDNADLDEYGFDFGGSWEDMNGEETSGGGTESGEAPESSSLTARFIIPPFSVLDTRKGYWQDRKRLWHEKIGDFGETRKDDHMSSPELKYKDLYLQTKKERAKLGISFAEYIEKYVPKEVLEKENKKILSQGVSLLDPVMAEIVCKWFTPCKGAATFDCFAGDTVFGYVSATLGNKFTGIEIRKEQADFNNSRTKEQGLTAEYINDDGQNVEKHLKPESQDLLFSCPPYFNLEHYSDLPNDASNQKSYEDFIRILSNAFTGACRCLKNNRFAVIVVGDIRNIRTGFYYDFVGDIKKIFKDAGLHFYNDIILVETGASTALRASRNMIMRKVGKMHQNILVFYKGDNQQDIKQEFPVIEYNEEDEKLFNAELSEQGNAEQETDKEQEEQ